MRDVSAQDIAANARVSFQITQATFPGENYCHSVTAEDPTCVRLTLSGNVRESWLQIQTLIHNFYVMYLLQIRHNFHYCWL